MLIDLRMKCYESSLPRNAESIVFESMLFPLTYGYIKCHSYKVFLQNDQKLVFFVFKSLY